MLWRAADVPAPHSRLNRCFHSQWRWGLLALLTAACASQSRAETVLKGDLNRDAKITTADAILALNAVVGLSTLDANGKLIVDVNGDGKVNTADATLILRRVVGLIPDLGEVILNPDTSAITASIVRNETVFSWPKTGKKTGILTFKQGGQQVTLTRELEVSGDREQVRLQKTITRQIRDGIIGNDYAMLDGFASGQPITVTAVVGDTAGGPTTPIGTLDVMPAVHEYDPEIYGPTEAEVDFTTPFSNSARVGDTVTISGNAKTTFANGQPQFGLRADAYFILPSGLTRKATMTTSSNVDTTGIFGTKIPPGGNFHFSLPVESDGTYIVEINDYAGLAAFSQPIYAGERLPLLPGPLDAQGQVASGTSLDLNAAQVQWLTLVNTTRAKFGLQSVILDPDLSKAAQAHADEMEAFNYLSHIGILDSSTPQSRAIQAGEPATTQLTENLGVGGTVEDLHNALMASAIHRDAMLNPIWQRVGMGVSHYNKNLLMGVQELGVPAGGWEIPADFFDGVKLDQSAPTQYLTGQTYTLSGKVLTGQNVVVFFLKSDTREQIVFPDFPLIPDNDGHFSIDVTFKPEQAGAYLIGISLAGNDSKAVSVLVTNP